MKNIHVLPTDKPSYLFIIDKSRMFLPKPPYLSFSKFGGRVHKIEGSELYQPQHIYITDDSEIKEGDWFLNTLNNKLDKCDDLIYEKNVNLSNWCKKIILTDNEDLIKDGVQSIDYDFLEWFVNNPSCEMVEISLEETQYGSGIYEYVIYKKEIPKEEPKPFKQMEKLTEVDWKKFKKSPFSLKKEPKKIFDLPIATNLGSALTETMKSVSQHEGGIRQGEINLPSFKEEVCTCKDECLGYLTKSCKRIEEPEQRLEKYSERFDNKENEVVDGIFNPVNWGRRVVKQETLEESKQKRDINTCRYFDIEVGCEREECICENIPKEKYKQDNIEQFKECIKSLDNSFKEQKTLKEVAERLSNTTDEFNMFIAGAKWQAEQIYNLIKELYDNENITGFSKKAYAQCLDIVEQFKKK